jgi:hypothetical protein
VTFVAVSAVPFVACSTVSFVAAGSSAQTAIAQADSVAVNNRNRLTLLIKAGESYHTPRDSGKAKALPKPIRGASQLSACGFAIQLRCARRVGETALCSVLPLRQPSPDCTPSLSGGSPQYCGTSAKTECRADQ